MTVAGSSLKGSSARSPSVSSVGTGYSRSTKTSAEVADGAAAGKLRARTSKSKALVMGAPLAKPRLQSGMRQITRMGSATGAARKPVLQRHGSSASSKTEDLSVYDVPDDAAAPAKPQRIVPLRSTRAKLEAKGEQLQSAGEKKMPSFQQAATSTRILPKRVEQGASAAAQRTADIYDLPMESVLAAGEPSPDPGQSSSLASTSPRRAKNLPPKSEQSSASNSPKRRISANVSESPTPKKRQRTVEKPSWVTEGKPPQLKSTRSAPGRISSWLYGDAAEEAQKEPEKESESQPVSYFSTQLSSPPPVSLQDVPKIESRGSFLSQLLGGPPAQPEPAGAAPPPEPRKRRLVDSLKAVSFSLDKSLAQEGAEASDSEGKQDSTDDEQTRKAQAPLQPQPPVSAPALLKARARTLVRTHSAASSSITVTYGETRSYLAEAQPQSLEEQVDAMISAPADEPDMFDEGLSSADEGTGIKSAHELRAAGDQSRFVDGLDMLLHDAEIGSDPVASTASRRRSALRELARKCADKGYVTRLCTFSFEKRVLLLGLTEPDPIALSFWAIAVCFVIRWSKSVLLPALLWEVFFEGDDVPVSRIVQDLLAVNTELHKLAQERKMNMSKAGAADIGSFSDFVRASEAWKENILGDDPEDGSGAEAVYYDLPLSPENIGLLLFDKMIKQVRSAGYIEFSILSIPLISKLSEISARSASGLSSLFNGTGSATAELQRLSLVLSIFERESMANRTTPLEEAATRMLFTTATLILGTTDTVISLSPFPLYLYTLSLRLALNLAIVPEDSDKFWADEKPLMSLYAALIQKISSALGLLESSIQESHRSSTGPVLPATRAAPIDTDVLILILGLCINTAEHSPLARAALLRQHDQATAQSPSHLAVLVRTFSRTDALIAGMPVSVLQAEAQRPDSVFSKLQVAHGYAAVLIGYLCQHPRIAEWVGRGAVAAPDAGRGAAAAAAAARGGDEAGLARSLVRTIREFVVLHRAVDGATAESRPGPDADADADPDRHGADADILSGWSSWTDRIMSVADRLEASLCA